MIQPDKKALACVIGCYDRLVHTEVTRHYDDRFGKGNWWPIFEPGGIKNFTSPDHPSATDYIVWKIELAMKIAPFGLIVLLPHSHCVAYELAGKTFRDPKEEEAFQKEEIEKAIRVLREKFPNVSFQYNFWLKGEDRMAWGMQ